MGSPENRPRSSVFGVGMGWVLGMGARRGCRQSLGGAVRCGGWESLGWWECGGAGRIEAMGLFEGWARW